MRAETDFASAHVCPKVRVLTCVPFCCPSRVSLSDRRQTDFASSHVFPKMCVLTLYVVFRVCPYLTDDTGSGKAAMLVVLTKPGHAKPLVFGVMHLQPLEPA